MQANPSYEFNVLNGGGTNWSYREQDNGEYREIPSWLKDDWLMDLSDAGFDREEIGYD